MRELELLISGTNGNVHQVINLVLHQMKEVIQEAPKTHTHIRVCISSESGKRLHLDKAVDNQPGREALQTVSPATQDHKSGNQLPDDTSGSRYQNQGQGESPDSSERAWVEHQLLDLPESLTGEDARPNARPGVQPFFHRHPAQIGYPEQKGIVSFPSPKTK